jgi:cytochrome c oxidase assembly factor CtaG
MRTLARFLPALLLLVPCGALAHGADPHGNLPAWTFDPWVVLPLVGVLALYLVGLGVLWRRAGAGHGIRFWQAGCYLAGWLALAGALLSPLHWWGEHLFTAHMIEHEVVMIVAAPLLVLGRPLGAGLWAWPAAARRQVGRLAQGGGPVGLPWRLLTRPAVASLLHALAIWVWHVPALFDATVTSTALHRLQHLSFLLSALLFWWAMLHRAHPGTAAAHLFATMVHTGILGAVLCFAPRVLFRAQTAQAVLWGLTPLEDQQLAGLVMWVPGGIVYIGAALAFVALWIRRSGGWKDGGDALRAS